VSPQSITSVATVPAVAPCVALTGCGRSADTPLATGGTADTTPAGTKPTGPLVWATYHDAQTLDLINAVDYPEGTGLSRQLG